LPPKPDGASVVVVTDESGGDVDFAVEKEPNETVATATALSFGESGTAGVKAELELPDSKGHAADVFKLTIPPPPVLVAEATPAADGGDAGDGGAVPVLRRRLSVVLTGEAAGLSLDALDDRGAVLMSDSTGVGEEAGFPNWSVLPGTYFVRVRPTVVSKTQRGAGGARLSGVGGTTGMAPPAEAKPYRMTLRLSTPEPGDESEPNGKATLAQPATADDEIAGYFGSRRDEDWYRVSLAGIPEGNLLSLDLSPVPGVAGGLALYDASEHRLIDRRGRKEEALALRDLAWPQGAASVYVVVRAEAGKSASERYRLRIRNQPSSPETEVEPNDDAAHALPLAEGTSQGTLGHGDVDVYRFKVEEARIAALDVVPPERVDVKVDVIREGQGTAVVHLDHGRRHEPESVPNLFLVPGSYLVRLSVGSGDGNPDEPYRLTLALRSPDPGEEREPNDTQARATLLSPPAAATPAAPARGWLAPQGDVDLWRFDHPSGTPAGMLRVDGLPDLGMEVKVTTAAGKDVAHASVSAGASASLNIPVSPDACCFIQIREKSGKLANARDSYGLALSFR